MGIIKKRNNKLSLTQKGKKLLENDSQLTELLFTTFCRKFNWVYFDGYDIEQWGQLGFGFSLVLLRKYGGLKREGNFYAEKYFNAFPNLLDFHPFSENIQRRAYHCYLLRTFERFLAYFGFVEYDRAWRDNPRYVVTTKLFNSFLQ